MPFWRRTESAHSDDSELWLVVGLGNPGPRYRGTRHNAGFMVVERLADRHHVRLTGSKHRADVGRGTIEGVPALLAEPLTYMNESGLAVKRLMAYYKVPPRRVLVVCDDLDIPFGTLRLRPDGSSGGNGGLKSIIRETGTQEFPRLRFGIGRPAHTAVSHVLQDFSAEEASELPALLDVASDAVTATLREGVAAAMNRFNRSWLQS